jgi:hypothetical protein
MWEEEEEANSTPNNLDAVRREAVRIAELEALKDTREIGANNRGPIVDIYLKNAHALKSDTPGNVKGKGWCGMFIYYCYSQAAQALGRSLPFSSGNLWSGHHLEKWSLSYWDRVVYEPPILPGDIYIMSSYHIGMVIEEVTDYNLVKTIDGNQTGGDAGSNSVKKCLRSFYDMRVIIRI